VLSHVRGRLAVQSTRVSLCIGLWSSQEFLGNEKIIAALGPDNDKEEGELPMDWDAIHASYVKVQGP